MLTVIHVEESGWACLVRGTRVEEGMVGHEGDSLGSWYLGWPGCDFQHGRFTLAFSLCGMAHASSLLLLLCENPTRLLWSVSSQCTAVPTRALCFSGSLCIPDLLQWNLCFSLLQKGSLFAIFLCNIWSCSMVRTEWLGSAGSPTFSSSFGHSLLLCAYMLTCSALESC